ncbi:Aste57867_11431 [Aphanomyces stellatus]|uniref:Aste57867_11431 protein n=1 Tax=Aphanomyces stellatus TaxID=120398 RepID=A0A485KTH9_9STRA|nr:hypothetical protein As57867_011389 [Aphanomyces stellatus]VFT88292.1 Aste57867_11431 [Aphanomyces stellatus]
MGADDGSVMLAIVDKVLQRRQYFREKQRMHRLKVAKESAAEEDEIAVLRAVVGELEAQIPEVVGAVGSDGALSWSLVASVFRTNSRRSLASRHALAEQTSANDSLTKNMQRFVSLNLHTPAIQGANATWQPATLLAEPDARKLGKEWLTQRMYHHTDACLRNFPDVPKDQQFAHIDADVSSDGALKLVEATQSIWPGTMESFRYFLTHHMHSLLFHDPAEVIIEHTANTRLYRKLTKKGSLVNYLQGSFVEADRMIVVLRQIEADEAIDEPSYRQQYHFMAWLEIRPLSDTHIVTRLLTHQSQHFRPNGQGFLSPDEQAELWEVDLKDVPEDRKMEELRRRIVEIEYAELPEWRQEILDILTKAQEQEQSECTSS